MSSPADATTTIEQPHLLSLVLQSQRALQDGEKICSRANDLSNSAAQSAVDVLVLDAKVRWLTDGVLEQLKLTKYIAKTIEDKRTRLGRRVQARSLAASQSNALDLTRSAQEWDSSRTIRSDALDAILESLGTQVVPPDFHQHSSVSSLFGSQHSDHEEPEPRASQSPRHSLSSTIQNAKKLPPDRSAWKTLRDFVDDKAIDDVLEKMEEERNILDDILIKTDEFPETLTTTAQNITASLPDMPDLPPFNTLIMNQDNTITVMARHLESLAAHYEQMAIALNDHESGEPFGEEDLQAMNRDTDELPSIIKELEDCLTAIINAQYVLVPVLHNYNSHKNPSQVLSNSQEESRSNLIHLNTILDNLDELGEIMTDMLQTQESVEIECEEKLAMLDQHLLTVEHLHDRYIAYQTTFNKLLIEIARRRQYREAAEKIVAGMNSQLGAMTEEESHVRERFNSEHGAHLPEDLCLCIGDPPTRWEVGPWNGEEPESLPSIDSDLLLQAKNRLVAEESADP
ncbi:unnamed protein product [Mycena citricolor]|uniref:Autophagy-related protein 17 n=1 Tax=Mycena citricolor TaxID=2018698 RepID=A0AAD2H3Y5_9AGAR|nr:unnamed protein product [Mycena citricolor]